MYVQYFLTKDEWSASESDWQKMNLEEEVGQLSRKVGNIGFYFCDTNGATDSKGIITGGNFENIVGGCFLVKFKSGNNSNAPTLQFDSLDAYPIYINGVRATKGSWGAQDIIRFYFDGTNYQGEFVLKDDTPTFSSPKAVTSDGIYKSINYLIKEDSGTTSNTVVFSTGVSLKKDRTYIIYFKSDTLATENSDNGVWILVNGSFTRVLSIPAEQLYAGYYYQYTPSADCDLYLRIKQVNIGYSYKVSGLIADEFAESIERIDKLEEESFGTFENVTGASNTTGVIYLGINLLGNHTYNIYSKTATQISASDNRIGLWIDNGAISQIVTLTPEQLYQGVNYEYTPASDCVLYLRTYQENIQYEVQVFSTFPAVSEEIDKRLKALQTQVNPWCGKNLSVYGDSIAAMCNGNFNEPYSYGTTALIQNWGNRSADFLKMAAQYGRGVGSQGYKWNTAVAGGGSVTFINADGTYNSRNNSYNLDNYTGTIPSGCTAVRGCLSSWLRITTMYPASIKDKIHAIIVMSHNDSYDDSACAFIANDTTDPEWAASGADYYGKINGDYDLTTLRGGIASTIMKLQMWMPQAVIILSTGISGSGTAGQINTDINNAALIQVQDAVREMHKLTAIPLIDSAASDGINGWNRLSYIADGIHPYSEAGAKMVARGIIGGMRVILPML